MEEQTVLSLESSVMVNETEIHEKYLTFWSNKQLFGVSIASVEQIVSMQKIVSIPEFPSYAKGIINLRGSIIPVIDIRLRLGKEERAYDDHTCIIVTCIFNNLIGYIVDEVDEVMDIKDEQISMPPKVGGDVTNNYVQGIARLKNDTQDKIVLCLDMKKMLKDEEFASLIQS